MLSIKAVPYYYRADCVIVPGMTCFRLIGSVKASSVLRREFVMLMPLGTGRTEFGQSHNLFVVKQRAWIRADQFGAGRVALWASSPPSYLTTPRPTRLSFELEEVIAVGPVFRSPVWPTNEVTPRFSEAASTATGPDPMPAERSIP